MFILFAIFVYDENTPFPSLYALVPVGGTALIIMYAGRETWIARLLSLKGFVGIGLISYSAYLWHQPLFAFSRIRSLSAPEPWLMLFLAIASLVLAYFSWRYIEAPFRKGGLPTLQSKCTIFSVVGVVGAAFIFFGMYVHFNEGIKSRISISGASFAELNIDAKLINNYGLHSDCEGAFTLSLNCVSKKIPKTLLWGDSFAMHLAQALIADESSLPIVQHTMSSCSPILGISKTSTKYPTQWAERCINFNEEVYEWLIKTKTIEYVVLSSPFEILSSNIYTNGDVINTKEQFEIVTTNLKKTIRLIRQAGKKPVVISPPPSNGNDIGKCLSQTLLLNAPRDNCDFSTDEFSENTGLAYSFMEQISRFVPVIMLDKIICPGNQCDTMIDEIFIYRDGGHLSKEGSHLLGATHSLSSQVRVRADAFWKN